MGRLANMGNRQASDEIGKLMDAKGVPLAEVAENLNEYCSHLDDSAGDERNQIQNFLNVMIRRSNGDVVAAEEEKRPEVASSRTQEKEEKKEKRTSTENTSKGSDVKRAASPVAEKRPSGHSDRKEKKHKKEQKKQRTRSATPSEEADYS